ncbi:MAG: hypothetical protein AAF386_13660, partial [Pseudomonadota bacterium]
PAERYHFEAIALIGSEFEPMRRRILRDFAHMPAVPDDVRGQMATALRTSEFATYRVLAGDDPLPIVQDTYAIALWLHGCGAQAADLWSTLPHPIPSHGAERAMLHLPFQQVWEAQTPGDPFEPAMFVLQAQLDPQNVVSDIDSFLARSDVQEWRFGNMHYRYLQYRALADLNDPRATAAFDQITEDLSAACAQDDLFCQFDILPILWSDALSGHCDIRAIEDALSNTVLQVSGFADKMIDAYVACRLAEG